MKQTVLIPLDKLPEGISPTGQTLVDQSLVCGGVHDHRSLRGRGDPQSSREFQSGRQVGSQSSDLAGGCSTNPWSGFQRFVFHSQSDD